MHMVLLCMFTTAGGYSRNNGYFDELERRWSGHSPEQVGNAARASLYCMPRILVKFANGVARPTHRLHMISGCFAPLANYAVVNWRWARWTSGNRRSAHRPDSMQSSFSCERVCPGRMFKP